MAFFSRWFSRSPQPASVPAATAPATPPVAFPFPTETVAGRQALARWRELRTAGRSAGFYPVIVGDPKEAARLAENVSLNPAAPAAILQAASRLSADAVLRHRAGQDPDLLANVELGEWPAQPSRPSIITPFELLGGQPKREVLIAQLPTLHSWEVPALLRFGAWNDCPAPEEHVALHRAWHERYGAEIVALTGDVMECLVARPPQTRDEALALAREHFAYCPDVVFQGVETLTALAAALHQHDTWYFWWD